MRYAPWLVVLGFLGLGALLIAIPPGTAQPGADRTEGCATCAEMLERVPADELHEPAHDFACAGCHHPHEERTRAQWRQTCYTSDCHPRAWTETVFHRVEAEVFVECMNCHVPHRWSADGDDCQSCHGNLAGPAGDVPAPGVAGAERFPHARHPDLACRECHSTTERHAALVMTEVETCMSCHHGPEAGVDCATCHGGALTGVRRVNATLEIAGTEYTRRLPFDHARHAELPCEQCHAGANALSAGADCAGCHENHHRAEADCAVCHSGPPANAHVLEVHADRTCAGSGCHGEGSGVLALDFRRNQCLSCHEAQQDHEPGLSCAGCHKLTPESRRDGR